MPISQTRTVQRVEVYPAQEEGAKPRLMVVYEYTFKDIEDGEAPMVTTRVVNLNATTAITNEEGETTEIETDVSSHDEIVQTIASAVWAD